MISGITPLFPRSYGDVEEVISLLTIPSVCSGCKCQSHALLNLAVSRHGSLRYGRKGAQLEGECLLRFHNHSTGLTLIFTTNSMTVQTGAGHVATDGRRGPENGRYTRKTLGQGPHVLARHHARSAAPRTDICGALLSRGCCGMRHRGACHTLLTLIAVNVFYFCTAGHAGISPRPSQQRVSLVS